ncbi:hypothetical protein LTR37_019776 [Vermiconidia calcicola]|uniref:Uncharacterized protein n=1 Tax=Vermiconidia calcicola TaxID=1690605 RepID=A0ACC3MDB6_9PEZI|nr:hypothetical protein LTR37_019776 [Vermiconidia calcicola]
MIAQVEGDPQAPGNAVGSIEAKLGHVEHDVQKSSKQPALDDQSTSSLKWECGDWKWGNFRRHCQAEYRMGETCGMKLVYNTIPTEGRCSMCVNLERKLRRYEKTKTDYGRWANDPTRKASAAKALEDLSILAQEIQALNAQKEGRKQNVGNGRRQAPTRIAA